MDEAFPVLYSGVADLLCTFPGNIKENQGLKNPQQYERTL